MTTEIVFRFLIGGIVVSVFALLGDIFRPKRFAGLFGAAPSVGLTFAQQGAAYVSLEARSMLAGAVALLVYSACASWLLMRAQWSSLWGSLAALPLWFGAAFGLWFLLLQ